MEATGRKKLIIAGISDSTCLQFPSLDAVLEGFDAHAVIDASGAASALERQATVATLAQAGVKVRNWWSVGAELIEKDVLAYYLRGIRSIIAAAKAAGVPRLLVVGGAGSLNVAPGKQLIDTPEFPENWKGTAEGARQALALLREESELNWTMLSPSALIEPGRRTGKFRIGDDDLLIGENGASRISVEDFAFAMIDEIERPAHPRRRFTVGC